MRLALFFFLPLPAWRFSGGTSEGLRAETSPELDRDKDSIKLRGLPPLGVPSPSIFSQSLLFSSILTVTTNV
jgi:hypothetical protein